MSRRRFWNRKPRSVERQPLVWAPAPLPATERPGRSFDLDVSALGGTDVWVRGVRVPRWRSARGTMVLRYLLLHRDRAVHREVLMELLWPGSSPQAARNNLNVAIYGLRRSLEDAGVGPFIIHRAGTYALDGSLSVRLDIDEFVDRARAARIEAAEGDDGDAISLVTQALDLYGGPLFADDPDGEWYSLTRRELADVHLDLLELDAELHLRTGIVPRCVDVCHESLRLDPCRESTHRLLMRAYVAEHRYHLVARQYADCVAALATELGVGPQPETTGLFSDLLADRS